MLDQPANKANEHARKFVKTVLSHTCQSHEQTRFLATKCVIRNARLFLSNSHSWDKKDVRVNKPDSTADVGEV